MKRIAVFLMTLMLVASPAMAGHKRGLLPGESPVTKTQYKAIQIGWSRTEIQGYIPQTGNKTLSWSDAQGDWIQKEYIGAKIPDQFQGTATKMVVDYNFDVAKNKWVNQYQTWCVWDNLSMYVCSDQKLP